LESDYRREFADFGDVVYLNASYHAPLPLAAVRAAHEALEWKMRPYQIPDRIHFDLPDRIRAKIAQLIGAQPDEIAVTTGASAGMASVAASIEWKSGDEVLVGRGEFPSHVSASLVRFNDGARLDAARVAQACHAVGAFLLLDMAQCAGAIPIAVRELGADFAVCSGYKWLLGPYGTGFFWADSQAAERLEIGPLYFMALEGAREFHMMPMENQRAVPGARRWDSAEPANFTNLAALDASLDLILRLGSDAIVRHTAALVGEILRRLPDSFVLASPPEPERRGPYICIAARSAEETAAACEKLRAARIHVSLRENAIRISPYLYNTPEHVSRLIDVLSAGGS
jgi:cysteine desulfurase / selenocysteine lyase